MAILLNLVKSSCAPGGGKNTNSRFLRFFVRSVPLASFFFGVRIRLGTILGRFSIIYFRGLGLRIRVRVWVGVGVGVRVSVVLWAW